MAKTSARHERIRQQAARDPEKFDDEEIVSAVCKYFVRGLTIAEIRETIQNKLGIALSREEPYRILSFAAQKDRFIYNAPFSSEARKEIIDRHRWLKDVCVVQTGVSDDVSLQCARMLLKRVCDLGKDRAPNSEVHIGFAGGKSLRKTARHFAHMLREPHEHLPRRIVFHAIVAGFNVSDPTTDPNGFFTFFANDPDLQVQTSFMGLPMPGVVPSAEMERLRNISYLRAAFDGVRELDIIVTSAGGHWQQGHSSFCSMFRTASPETVAQLDAAGCIGDMLWRPLGDNGPLRIDMKWRTVTLIELADLPDFVARGKDVLLLLGPCGNCGGPKGEVLRSVLSTPNLISHLVVDTRSVREYFKMISA
jgi:DNA-binding transcriptional regulator LsrR (DeoR family)